MSLKNFLMTIVIILMIAIFPTGVLIADNIGGDALKADLITHVPRSMTYQGILKDSSGEPISDSLFDGVFRIFDNETIGNQEWSQTITDIETDEQGRFTVTFTNVDLAFDEDYWLEIEVNGTLLTPRQKLNMTPFAGASVVADYAGDSNLLDGYNSSEFAEASHTHSEAAGWVDDGPVVRLENSNDDVGIGTLAPQAPLHVVSDAAEPWGTIYGNNTSASSHGYLGGSAFGVYGSGNSAGVYGVHLASGNFGNLGSSTYGVYGRSDAGFAGYFYGNVQITSDLYVANNVNVGTKLTTTAVETPSFRLNNGAVSGYVLTSDASGYGTWQPAAGLSGTGTANYLSKFTASDNLANSQIFDNGTDVGIGVTTPSAKLDVNGDIHSRNGLIVDNSAQIADLVDASRLHVGQFRMITGASANYILTSDASGNGTWQVLNAITGPGTVGSIPKYSGTNTITSSVIVESGSNIGIGTTPSSAKLDVNGNARVRSSLTVDNSVTVADLVEANRVYVSQFRKTGGASAGYVLTSDASGNGTWQALPSFINPDSIRKLEAKIDELVNTVKTQNEKIEQLETKLANFENRR